MSVCAFAAGTPRLPPLRAAVLACFSFAFLLAGCEKNHGSPDWDLAENESQAVPHTETHEVANSPAQPEPVPANQAENPTASPSSPEHGGLRFIAYNVENWLTMDRVVDRKLAKGKPKPTSEKQAVIRILAAHKPDVVGLCEIGTAADLAEIQQQLKSAGIDLPHSHYGGGSDPVRHLGLLSRFPITATSKAAKMDYRLEGKTLGFSRGVLDTTVTARKKSYRFLGAHLKSKRQTPDGDQEQMRISEARLLRQHVDSILAKNANARLVVYGDFNDSRQSRAFKVLTGNYNSPGYLTPVPFRDSRGHAWTHHWRAHDIYSRIDYVTVSRALRRELDFQKSYLIDDANWHKASDHRPLMAIFR